MTKLDVPLIDLKLHDINPLFTGSEVCEGGNFVGPLVRDHYLIHYVIKGTGVFSNATGDYPVKSRQIFLIRPGELYSYVSDKDDPWSYIWVGFNGAVVERLKDLPSPVMDYREDTFFDLQKVTDMSSMREEFVTSKIYEIICVLYTIFHACSKTKSACPPTTTKRVFTTAPIIPWKISKPNNPPV